MSFQNARFVVYDGDIDDCDPDVTRMCDVTSSNVTSRDVTSSGVTLCDVATIARTTDRCAGIHRSTVSSTNATTVRGGGPNFLHETPKIKRWQAPKIYSTCNCQSKCLLRKKFKHLQLLLKPKRVCKPQIGNCWVRLQNGLKL